jgi:predicted N-acetyltransferase YhbS
LENLILVKNVKDTAVLRDSFNELAMKVFGINFEDWYEKGFWTDQYVPFCYVDNGAVVANVSVNILDFIIQGEKKRALQIGTVMTHPSYRNRGLSKKLMNEVLASHEGKYDIMYLFANDTVLDFYPKFGFEAVDEFQFTLKFNLESSLTSRMKELDGKNVDDLKFIYNFARNRIPVSQSFSTGNAQELLMFYCIYVFNENIFYLEDSDVIAIFKMEGSELHIFDLISKKEFDYKTVLGQIASSSTEKVVFHFTPENNGLEYESYIYKGSEQLFVKLKDSNWLPKVFKHPYNFTGVKRN